MESIHPALVHFPIALLLASLFIEALALIFRKEVWHVASLWTLLLGWAGAIAAVLTGRQAMAAAKHSMEIHELMERHENIGYVVLAAATLLVAWRLIGKDRLPRRQRWAAWVLLALTCGGMAYGATLGGEMVYEHGVGGSYGHQSGIEVVIPEHHH